MRPVYAHGIFSVHPGLVHMVVVFEYSDPERRYAAMLQRGDLEEEVEALWNNMQGFLDQEEVKFNGQRVRPQVEDVYIGLRGIPTRPYIEYVITFPAPLRQGLNTYENTYPEEEAEYDYEALWLLPRSARIARWQMAGQVETPTPNVLRLTVRRGTKVGGREGFQFLL